MKKSQLLKILEAYADDTNIEITVSKHDIGITQTIDPESDNEHYCLKITSDYSHDGNGIAFIATAL
jgi:hypothetical protein